MVRWICQLFLLALCLHAPLAQAAGEDPPSAGAQELANPFSDFVPFEDEYDVDEDERFMYFGRFFAVSLGSGIHRFGGNRGKLYNTALPIVDFHLVYFFDFRLAGQLGISTANHAYNIQGSTEIAGGNVEIKIFRINADLKYYFDTKNTAAAFTAANPYIVGGLSQVYHTSNFEASQTSDSSRTLGVSGGAGMEFALKPRKTSLGIEARIHELFLEDKETKAFEEIGLNDLTGNMYSLGVNVTFFF